MTFSDGDGPWQDIPYWVKFLIGCGFAWADSPQGKRRITVISMPCDSAGAALVALGATRRRLALSGADDLQLHFQRIERLAAQRAFETVLRHDSDRGRFLLRGRDSTGKVWVEHEQSARAKASDLDGPLRKAIIPQLANAWSFDGEPAIQVVDGTAIPHRPFYDALIEGAAPVIETNLRRSDSGICLAGRPTGETESRSVAAALRFQTRDQMANLAQLLTIHGWSSGGVSRTAFYNSRLGQLDRRASLPRLVVADGDAAFLRVVDAKEFKDSDVVGVIHRAVERDRLEAIGISLDDWGQWYSQDLGMLEALPPRPQRVSVLSLRRR